MPVIQAILMSRDLQVALAELAEQEAGEQEVLAHRQATNEMQVFSQINFRAKQGMKDLNRLHISYSDCISELRNEAEKETKLNLQLLHEEQRARRTIREAELVASGMSNDMIPVGHNQYSSLLKNTITSPGQNCRRIV